MSRTVTPAREPAFSPLRLSERSFAVQIGAVIFGTVLMTASSYVSVPMIPVPMTMQTLAATLIGALYGWRLGALTIAMWLLQGALGLPVFSNGGGGIAHLSAAPAAICSRSRSRRRPRASLPSAAGAATAWCARSSPCSPATRCASSSAAPGSRR